jgi:hypothetical protein
MYNIIEIYSINKRFPACKYSGIQGPHFQVLQLTRFETNLLLTSGKQLLV